MKFSNNTILISSLAVGLLVLSLVLYPVDAGYGFQVIRGLVLIGVLWLLLVYIYQRNTLGKLSGEADGDGQINLEERAFLNELKTHFKELIDSVFRAVKSIHPDYQAGIYMVDPESKGFTLQEATSPTFKKFITGHNEIINSILNSSEVIMLQESDIREGWDTVLNPKRGVDRNALWGFGFCIRIHPLGV